MSAPEAPRRIAELCDEAVHELNEARHEITQVQEKISDLWLQRRLESIDDRIHNALGKLGD